MIPVALVKAILLLFSFFFSYGLVDLLVRGSGPLVEGSAINAGFVGPRACHITVAIVKIGS